MCHSENIKSKIENLKLLMTIGFYIIIEPMSTFGGQNQYQTPQKTAISQKIKDFWLKHGERFILAFGIILIALVSFEAGFLKGQKNQKEPVVVNQAACPPAGEAGATCPKDANVNSANNSILQNTQNKNDDPLPADNQKCAFVASKNSNKYHLATCQWAAKIKSENKVCFSSAEEAQSRGYLGAKCCIK
jgi:hypothetical protein